MKKRSEIEEKYKWDLTSYYCCNEEFNNDLAYVKSNYKKISEFEGHLKTESDILKCFDFESNLSKVFSKLYVYASLKTKEDATNCESEEMLAKIEKLSVEYSALSSFVQVELSELSDDFLQELKYKNGFENYDLMLDDIIKFKKHMLSKKEEKILSLIDEFADDYSSVFEKFDNADVKYEDVIDAQGIAHILNMSNYGVYLENEDRKLRENAVKNVNKAFGNINYTLSANYNAHIKQDCFYSKIRGFNSALEASLYGEDVDQIVYKNLIESVNKNLNVMQKYFDLKKKQLGLNEIAIYDMSAPTCASLNLKLDFEEAFKLVEDACQVLGEEYISNLRNAIKDRWIDVYANVGKDTGAFSWGAYGCNPVVLLNYEKTTNDIFTIAHELGHAMHTFYSNSNQPYEKAGYEIFVAEVASTVNEMLLLRHQIEKAQSKQEKIYYYDYFMKMFRTTLFRQSMFAEFEKFAHEYYEKGGVLTSEVLNNNYYELNKKYFGENVKLIEEIKYEWSRVPHFYSSFYVYKYATGIISALIISNAIFNNDKEMLEKYLAFLKSGCTKNPVELLQIAGVDLTNIETFNNAFNVLNETIEKFGELL